MKLNLLSQATWSCMKCQGLPYGMDMVVMDPTNPSVRVVWDLFGDRVLSESVIANSTIEINERYWRCPECGSADVVIPNRVEEEPENDILASRSRIFVRRHPDRASSKDERLPGVAPRPRQTEVNIGFYSPAHRALDNAARG